MATITERTGRYTAQIRLTGFNKSRTFDKKSEATKWAKDEEARYRLGLTGDTRIIAKTPLGDLIDDYTRTVGEKKAKQDGTGGFGKNKAAVLKTLKRDLGAVLLPKLDARRLIAYIEMRHESGAGGVTIAIDLTYLKQIIAWGKKVRHLPLHVDIIDDARDAMEHLGLSSRSQERDRRPTEDELARLIAYFKNKPRQRVPVHDLIPFAIATTMRSSEIFSLRWDDIVEADRTVLVRDRKDPKKKIGNNQTVPLLGDAWEIAMRQPRTSEFIFPYNARTISTIFPRACQELGIVDLHWHDLRHEGISRLFEAGYQIHEVALVSGHKDWKQLARYTQIKAKSLHRDASDEKKAA